MIKVCCIKQYCPFSDADQPYFSSLIEVLRPYSDKPKRILLPKAVPSCNLQTHPGRVASLRRQEKQANEEVCFILRKHPFCLLRLDLLLLLTHLFNVSLNGLSVYLFN